MYGDYGMSMSMAGIWLFHLGAIAIVDSRAFKIPKPEGEPNTGPMVCAHRKKTDRRSPSPSITTNGTLHRVAHGNQRFFLPSNYPTAMSGKPRNSTTEFSHRCPPSTFGKGFHLR